MSLGNKVSNVVHRSLVVVLAGVAVYSFVGASIMINRRFEKSKEMYTRQELQKLSQQNSENIVMNDDEKES